MDVVNTPIQNVFSGRLHSYSFDIYLQIVRLKIGVDITKIKVAPFSPPFSNRGRNLFIPFKTVDKCYNRFNTGSVCSVYSKLYIEVFQDFSRGVFVEKL